MLQSPTRCCEMRDAGRRCDVQRQMCVRMMSRGAQLRFGAHRPLFLPQSCLAIRNAGHPRVLHQRL